MSVGIIEKPFKVYSTNQWDQIFRFKTKAGDDPAVPETIVNAECEWRVSEDSPIALVLSVALTGPGEIKVTSTQAQNDRMQSDGVFDIRINGEARVKGFTVWDEGVTK